MRIPHIVYLNVQIWLCVLLVFPRTHVVLAWVYMLQCTHVCGGCCAGIFVCGICVLISIINRRKLIQFIAFTYWPESFYREGLWLTGCVRKQEERKGESWKEREKGKKKWKHVCVKIYQGLKMFFPHIETQSSPRLAAFASKSQEKLNSQRKYLEEVRIYRYECILTT